MEQGRGWIWPPPWPWLCHAARLVGIEEGEAQSPPPRRNWWERHPRNPSRGKGLGMSYRGRERRIWPEGREERRQGSSDLGCTPARPAGTRRNKRRRWRRQGFRGRDCGCVRERGAEKERRRGVDGKRPRVELGFRLRWAWGWCGGPRTAVGSASIRRCSMHDPRETSTDQSECSMML